MAERSSTERSKAGHCWTAFGEPGEWWCGMMIQFIRRGLQTTAETALRARRPAPTNAMLQSLIFLFAFRFSLPPTQCPSKADCRELTNAVVFILHCVIMKSSFGSLNLEVMLSEM